MPNWVTTRCVVEGANAAISRFKTRMVGCEPDGSPLFDFNRVLPMPDILKATNSGGSVNDAIEVLTGRVKPHIFGFLPPRESCLSSPRVQQKGITTLEQMCKYLESSDPGAMEQGRLSLEAYHSTGYYDWYDWSIANWGTKWNSAYFHEASTEDQRYEFLIDTAWSFPEPVFRKLEIEFPELRFDCVFFDEMWNFAGHCRVDGGFECTYVDANDEYHQHVYGVPPYRDELEIDAA